MKVMDRDPVETPATDEEPRKALPAKIPQPHGGALYAAGVPGNDGGGRPPSMLRKRLAVSLEKRIPVLEQIADGAAIVRLRSPDGEERETLISAPVGERLKAIDLMGKYSIGTVREMSTDQVRERIRETLNVIRARLPKEQASKIILELREVWTR